MRKYPSTLRASRLKKLFESLRIEANHHLFADHDCRGRTAVVLRHQFADRRIIRRDIPQFKIDSPLREEGLSNAAGRSAWLTEYDYFWLLHSFIVLMQLQGSEMGAPRQSPAIVRLRFCVNQNFEQFRCGLLEANLQSCRDVMYLRQRKIVRQRCVT